jgi:hypothetical protein
MLLSNALTYFFKSTGFHPVLNHVKLFMKYLLLPPVGGCDPSLGFYKEEIRSGSKGDHQ